MLQISNSAQNYNPSFGRVILSHSAEKVLETGDYVTKYKLEKLDELLKKSESNKNYKPVDVFIDYSNTTESVKSIFKQFTGKFDVFLGTTAEAPLFSSVLERRFNDRLFDIVKRAIEKIKQQNRTGKV